MILKAAIVCICAFLLLLFLFHSCAGVDRIVRPAEQSGGSEKTVPAAPRGIHEFSAIRDSYDLESLLLPVLQYNNLSLSFDFFPQFMWNRADIFPRYLARAFILEQSPYRTGEGTVLTAGYEGIGTELRIERSLLSSGPEGRWWQIRHTYFDETIFYEVLVSLSGQPVRIRYLNPETNHAHEVDVSAVDLGESSSETTEEEDPSGGESGTQLPELRAQEYAREWSYAFNQPVIVGEELIAVAAGQFMTVHVRDAYEDEYGTGADYWISPDVPGNIVRIQYSSPGQEPYIVELTELTVGNVPMIQTAMAATGPRDVNGSEGSPTEPRMLTPDGQYVGMVAPLGTSYYGLAVQRRSDIYISIEVLQGEAELSFYGADPTFYNRRSSMSGDELFAEEYFVDQGVKLFFSVANPSADGGREYMISIVQDVMISPIGVSMRGEIYRRARELRPDMDHELTLSIDGLSYYKTRVRRGRNLRITARGLPDAVELVWVEALDGSASSVYTFRERDVSSVEITGVSPGTVCYFYVVADMRRTPLDSVFYLNIEEYSR